MRPDTEYIVFYGTLMRGPRPFLGAQQNIPSLDSKICYVQDCEIGGHLYDLGSYPGLVETRIEKDPPQVRGELYEVLDQSALLMLDEYEGFDRDEPEISRYVRKLIDVRNQSVRAWCYFYNWDLDQDLLIPSGNWRTHIES